MADLKPIPGKRYRHKPHGMTWKCIDTHDAGVTLSGPGLLRSVTTIYWADWSSDEWEQCDDAE